jgi:hypothetical protein
MVASVVIKSYFTAVGYSFSLGGSAAAGDTVATLMDAVDDNDVSAAQLPPARSRTSSARVPHFR